jgi:hypothetical protein
MEFIHCSAEPEKLHRRRAVQWTFETVTCLGMNAQQSATLEQTSCSLCGTPNNCTEVRQVTSYRICNTVINLTRHVSSCSLIVLLSFSAALMQQAQQKPQADHCTTMQISKSNRTLTVL